MHQPFFTHPTLFNIVFNQTLNHSNIHLFPSQHICLVVPSYRQYIVTTQPHLLHLKRIQLQLRTVAFLSLNCIWLYGAIKPTHPVDHNSSYNTMPSLYLSLLFSPFIILTACAVARGTTSLLGDAYCLLLLTVQAGQTDAFVGAIAGGIGIIHCGPGLATICVQ